MRLNRHQLRRAVRERIVMLSATKHLDPMREIYGFTQADMRERSLPASKAVREILSEG
jgi:hypothetical protein